MKIKFKHNGVWSLTEYQIEEGAVITRNYNETLDSANVRITNLSTKISDIEPYDECVIDDTYYFCVDTYTETMVGVNPAIYCYDITLFSQTKMLEGYICPNLAITPLKSGTKRSIYDYLQIYLDLYGAKVRRYGYFLKKLTDISTTYNNTNDKFYINQFLSLDLQVNTINIVLEDTFDTPSGLYYTYNANTGVLTGEFNSGRNRSTDITESLSVLEPVESWSSFLINIGINHDGLNYDINFVGGGQATTRNVSYNRNNGILTGEVHNPDNSSFEIVYSYCVGDIPDGKIRISFKTTDGHTPLQENKWHFANRVANKFANDCPELQWNMPTLREVFNDLMMINDCIPILNNNEIDYLDLTQLKNNIANYNGINYIQNSQSSADYISELQMDMVNVMNTSQSNIKDGVTTFEYIPFNSNDYVITDENILIKTKYPILNIKHLWMVFCPATKKGETQYQYLRFLKFDLCNVSGYNFVRENQEYITLPVLYKLSSFVSKPVSFYNKYKNFNLHFTRFGKEISGFEYLTKKSLSSEKSTLSLMKYFLDQNNPHTYSPLNNIYNAFYSTYFQIEYETTADCMFRASKTINPTNERVVIDNQTNSFVDSYTQGNLEYQKANRLGNKQLMINQRNLSGNKIDIGDFYNNHICSSVQWQFYANHIEVNAQLTENYVLKNYFTGIKSKIRTWVNAKDEALERHDLIKLYGCFSYNQHSETLGYIESGNFGYYMLSPLYRELTNPLKVCALFIETKTSYFPIEAGRYLNSFTGRIIGNSIVLTTHFEDNWFYDSHPVAVEYVSNEEISRNFVAIDLQIESESQTTYTPITIKNSSIAKAGGIPLQPYSYCDSNGEMNTIYISFYTNKKVYSDNLFVEGCDVDVMKEAMIDWYKLPQIDYNKLDNSKMKMEFKFNNNEVIKDNKEIPKYSLQFEFCSDDKDIVFSKDFIRLQECISTQDLEPVKIYLNGVLKNNATINITSLNNSSSKIRIDLGVNANVGDTIAINSSDVGDLITFKVKTAGQTHDLYFNVIHNRNYNIYDANNNKIGTI